MAAPGGTTLRELRDQATTSVATKDMRDTKPAAAGEARVAGSRAGAGSMLVSGSRVTLATAVAAVVEEDAPSVATSAPQR